MDIDIARHRERALKAGAVEPDCNDLPIAIGDQHMQRNHIVHTAIGISFAAESFIPECRKIGTGQQHILNLPRFFEISGP